MKLIFGVLIVVQFLAQQLVVASDCGEQDIVVTVDDQLELYIDGQRVTDLPNANKVTVTDRVTIPAAVKVIAIKGTNIGGDSGIIASGANFRTDGSWKCTGTYYDGWESVDFNDSPWPNAHQVAQNGGGSWKTTFSDIHHYAFWIWTSSTADKVVYCRGKPAGVLFCHQLYAHLVASVSKPEPLPACGLQDLVITVDDQLELFVDGKQVTNLPNANKVTVTDSVKIPTLVKIIAVKGTDIGGDSGIIASGQNFHTDGRWKCTGTHYDGWEQESFDDSKWPAAKVVAQNGGGSWKTKFSDMSDDAFWIWTSSKADKVVYCRAKPSGVMFCPQLFSELQSPGCNAVEEKLPTCADQNFVINVDNELQLFIDGHQVTDLPNANDWSTPDTAKIPAEAQVVAVRGKNNDGIAGIIGSGDNFRTDGSWKCSDTQSDGWETVSFDDSHWPAASVIAQNGGGVWSKQDGISDDASWIWTADHYFKDGATNIVYCRARLPACAKYVPPSNCSTLCENRGDANYRLCNYCNV